MQTIDSFLTEWAATERAGDAEKLATLLTTDFTAVGPLGFILPRQAWLGRHREGELAYEAFDLDEIQTRLVGEAAVVISRNNTRGTYQGYPLPEAVRATLVLVRDQGRWKLAVIHMSFIAGTRGTPPIPGSGGRVVHEGSTA